MVVCAGFRNPALLAKMAHTMDEVSEGRLILGLGAGWHEPEFEAFGMPFDHRASRFEEAMNIIIPLLRDGRVDFEGDYYRARDCEILPRGPRESGPPVLVGAFGPRMTRLAAMFGDYLNLDWLGPSSDLPMVAKRVAGACLEVGRDPHSLGISGALMFAYPDEGPIPSWLTSEGQYITGAPREAARQLVTYRDNGVGHVQVWCYPMNRNAISRVSASVQAFRASG
jgi:alkanesulfonate monooxygenase SsuD/methylene tetrahydromethanopterin reductase-like flavin-dependent oxidoreductase (luciferase family)